MIQNTQHLPNVKDTIKSRNSIRKFVQETITKEELDELFELVRLAPSANNVQPWRFHVITDQKMKEKLQAAAYNQAQVTSAPAVIMVASDMEDTINNLQQTLHPDMSEEKKQKTLKSLHARFDSMGLEERAQWGLTQAGIALGFLLISAQGLGYATVPMLGFDQEQVKEILGLPEHTKFAAMVPIGHADEEGFSHHRHELKKVVTYY